MIFSAFERMVAWRYLRAKKAEGFVSVIAGFSFTGILLGVMTLIIVLSVMNGFREELFSRILGLNGHMNVYAPGGELYEYEPLAQRLSRIPGITEATPIIEAQGLLSLNGQSSGAMIRGVLPGQFAMRPLLRDSIAQGSLQDFTGNKLALGSVLARKFRVGPGDDIVLTSPQCKAGPFGCIPRQRKYEIAFVFDVGMHEYNAGFAFMPLEAAQKFFQTEGGVTAIEIILSNPDDLDVMRATVEIAMKGLAQVYDWRDVNKSFFDALVVERNVMFLILMLIILIAAFNIISSMIMLVKDKNRDIAIMRTMGATRRSMLKIFMLTGGLIGLSGTFVGAVLGIAFAANIETLRRWIETTFDTELFPAEIYFLSQLPAIIDWREVTTVIVIAFLLSFLATLYPAWRAARLDPVEALRNE